MRKYFELRRRNRDDNGSLYSLNLSGSPSEIEKIKKSIVDGILSMNSEILMEIDTKSGTGKKRLGDLVYWQKGSPHAHAIIVSSRFLEFLQTIKTPAFKIYKVNISNYHDGEYYIFHLVGDIFDQIDYSQQVFYKQNIINDSNEGYLEKGFASSKETFLQKRTELIKDQSQTLFFDNVVYKNEYDLLWGFPIKLIVNESIKKRIEELAFVLDFIEFNSYKIAYSS